MTLNSKLRRCAALGAAVVVLPAAVSRSPWIEARARNYSVFYQAGFEKDAAFAQAWADSTEHLMKTKYGVRPDHYRMSIYLLPEPTTTIGVGTARNRCCTAAGNGDSTGTIEMLAPSAPAMRTASAISSLGMPKNSPSYHAKILMSEYIPIGHYEVQRGRANGGWKYYGAPNWFVQGLQEYDAIFHTTDTNRVVTSQRLSDWAIANRRVFGCCAPDLVIADDYNGGAAFMAFLAAQFGEGIHAALLRSSAPTFAAALTEVTKPSSRPELFALFQQWLDAGAKADR